MNKKVLILCACIALIALCALTIIAVRLVPTGSGINTEEALSRYQNAIYTINTTKDLALKITHTKETTVNGEGFSETATQILRYKDRGTTTFAAIMTEQRLIGDHTIIIEEAYKNDTGYFTVQGSKFRSALSPEEYMNRYVPAVLIDPGLYANITAGVADTLTTIEFSDATAPESWMQDHNATFLQAEGSVQLTDNDQLHQSTYEVSYSTDGAYIRHSIMVTFDSEDGAGVTVGFQDADYIPIAYLDGPRLLEIACGYILSSENITSTYNSQMSCEAFGDVREEQILLNITGGGNWSARLDTDITVTNTSREGDSSRLSKKELFVDGVYTAFTNGVAAEEGTVSKDTMESWCKDILVGTIMLPQYLADASVIESDKILHITFTANEDFVQHIGENACQILYQNPELLTQLAEAQTTDNLEAYLDLDISTGLPVAAGIHYKGNYIINGISYLLAAETDQTYNVLSRTAYNTIYEKAGA